MKTFFILLFSLFTTTLLAQKDTTKTTGDIESVSLTASGLTCSMCSKAIYKSLQKVPSVSKVDVDIENSVYNIFFKKDQEVNLKALEQAVTDAGFSVAKMIVNKSPKKK